MGELMRLSQILIVLSALLHAANAFPTNGTTSSEDLCSVISPHLPKECTCKEKPPLGLVAACQVALPSWANDTIGVKMDLEPCSNPADISLDITDTRFGIDYPIAGISAGKEEDIPIPGLSIAVPKIGNLGVDAAVLVEGNPDELTLKIGLNACLGVGKKDVCASQIPILDKFLPWYLLSGTYSFGHVCKKRMASLDPCPNPHCKCYKDHSCSPSFPGCGLGRICTGKPDGTGWWCCDMPSSTSTIAAQRAQGMFHVSCKNKATCLQLNIPGGQEDPFWKANSYKYDVKEHPECAPWGATCGEAYPKWLSVIHNVQGYKGVDLVKYGKP